MTFKGTGGNPTYGSIARTVGLVAMSIVLSSIRELTLLCPAHPYGEM